MSTRRGFLATTAAALAPVLARPAGAQSIPVIRVGMAPTDGITPVLYAIQTGAFKDAGLDVSLNVGNNGAAQTAALLSGSLEVAAAALMPLLNAHLKGVPLKVIAGSTLYNPAAPVSGACVAKSSRFRSFADLSGATIMTSTLRSLSELGIRALVDRSGGSATTLKFIESPYAAMSVALVDGKADVASLTEPTFTVAMEGGNLRSLGDPENGIDPKGFMMAAFCCQPSYIERNRDVVARFTQTLYRVTAFTNAHHEETVTMLSQFTKMTPEVVRRMGRETIATSLGAGMIQPAIDVAAKYGYLQRWFDAKELLA